MFDHDNRRTAMRHHHREMRGEMRGEMGEQLRHELRRSLRHGAGRRHMSFRDIFSDARQGPPMRRGEIRPLILATLQDRPMHGYEVIQELEAQSGGRWRPSAGSVYPTLQQLADEGLVTSTEVDGRRIYTLTDNGRKAAVETGARTPWAAPDDDGTPDLRQLAMQLAAAVIQVTKLGSPQARGEATRILTDARKRMYRLLAEDEDGPADMEATEGQAATDQEARPGR